MSLESAATTDRAPTLLFREAAEAARVVAEQFERNAGVAAALASRLQQHPPRLVVTCARGSSDHAATYAKYLIETRTGCLTASAAPSLCSVYGARLAWQGALFIAISQSGRSPDLIAAAEAARRGGALVVALVNAEDAPLIEVADFVFPLCAGREQSVAASKSYIAALAALLHLVAHWSADAELHAACRGLPTALQAAWLLDWRAATARLAGVDHLYVIGRGLGLAVAQEAALKCKETSGLHAEAFSAAEVRHGPQALLGAAFPALLLVQDDETRAGLVTLGQDLVARGVTVLIAGAAVPGALVLPTLQADPAAQPLLLALCFYRLVNELALLRGHDPDHPPFLRKVTETH